MSKSKSLKKFARWIDGHFSIGKLTVFGDNAMHFGCTYHTKKYGFICFRLPIICGISGKILYRDKLRWYPLYLYFSPNATPWAATFMAGRGKSKSAKIEKVQAKLRKLKLGHNFSYDSENKDNNYRIMRQINNLG